MSPYVQIPYILYGNDPITVKKSKTKTKIYENTQLKNLHSIPRCDSLI